MTKLVRHDAYKDRHGKRRWRFRRAGKTIQLPGSPGESEFEVAYAAALEGRPVLKAEIRRLPTAAEPKSLRAAWRILITDTVDWKRLDPETQHAQTLIAERFLRSPVVAGEPLTFGDVAVANLQRKHMAEHKLPASQQSVMPLASKQDRETSGKSRTQADLSHLDRRMTPGCSQQQGAFDHVRLQPSLCRIAPSARGRQTNLDPIS
jgi:hypothetical protein